MIINLKEAKKILDNHGVIGLPTETVYGLAAKFDDIVALEKIYHLKNRPKANPLIVHVASLAQASMLSAIALPEFLTHFWPGPLTVILPAKACIPEIARAELSTIALRMPNHKQARDLLEAVGPLAAPSANLSGTPSSTKPEHIESDFGKDFPILEGEPSIAGLESTIIAPSGKDWVLLREGSTTRESLEEWITLVESSHTPPCPGTRFRHYAPQAQLLDGKRPAQIEAAIGFEGRSYPFAKKVYFLGKLENPEEVGHNLYALLRKLDTDGVKKAWIDFDFPKTGLLRTVHERLQKSKASCINR